MRLECQEENKSYVTHTSHFPAVNAAKAVHGLVLCSSKAKNLNLTPLFLLLAGLDWKQEEEDPGRTYVRTD